MPRLEVACIDRTGDAVIVNIGRPATLVAFGDRYDGRQAPESHEELAWSAHHALGRDDSVVDWLATLEMCSMFPSDVALARAIIAGDAHARRVALGDDPPDDDYLAELIAKHVAGEAGAPADVAADPTPPVATSGAQRSRG